MNADDKWFPNWEATDRVDCALRKVQQLVAEGRDPTDAAIFGEPNQELHIATKALCYSPFHVRFEPEMPELTFEGRVAAYKYEHMLIEYEHQLRQNGYSMENISFELCDEMTANLHAALNPNFHDHENQDDAGDDDSDSADWTSDESSEDGLLFVSDANAAHGNQPIDNTVSTPCSPPHVASGRGDSQPTNAKKIERFVPRDSRGKRVQRKKKRSLKKKKTELTEQEVVERNLRSLAYFREHNSTTPTTVILPKRPIYAFDSDFSDLCEDKNEISDASGTGLEDEPGDKWQSDSKDGLSEDDSGNGADNAAVVSSG